MDKIIPIKNYQKSKYNPRMLFFVLVLSAALALVLWHYFVENVAGLDVQIPPSKNVFFNEQTPLSLTTSQIANEFEKSDGKPILLYIYTTWCKICVKNFSVINEISREFQNTDLKVITLAIDRDLDAASLQQHLNHFGEIYFQPQFLAFREGFLEFLRKKNIRYDGRIPFTVLISRHGEIITKFNGTKNKNFLRNKIIKEIS